MFVRTILRYRNTPLPDTIRVSPAKIVFGREMWDLLPTLTLNYKYEPSQEWGLVREYRERAMARRLDRDGTQLENALKIINVTPVAATVAVQSWPTVTVVENQDYEQKLCKKNCFSTRSDAHSRTASTVCCS